MIYAVTSTHYAEFVFVSGALYEKVFGYLPDTNFNAFE